MGNTVRFIIRLAKKIASAGFCHRERPHRSHSSVTLTQNTLIKKPHSIQTSCQTNQPTTNEAKSIPYSSLLPCSITMPSSKKKYPQRKLFDNVVVIDDDDDEKEEDQVTGPPPIRRVNRTPPPTQKRATTPPPASFQSPAKKSRTKPAAVTPEDAHRKQDENQQQKEAPQSYVPTYLHKNVGYQRQGTSALSEAKQRAFAWICQRYVIPADLEQSRSAYGPLSGSSYEERVIQQYALDRLERNPDAAPDTETDVCTECGDAGHRRAECLSLI